MPPTSNPVRTIGDEPRPSLHLLPLAQAREVYERECAEKAGVGPRLAEVVDMHITADVTGRLYRPRPGIAPVVVYLHGGGWVLGGIDTHDRLCRELAERSRCAVLSVEYRRAPEHPFPSAVDDADAAVRWLRAAGSVHGLDPTRIAVAGDSAGGNLAVALALRERDRGLPLRLQLLLYPVTTTDLDAGIDPAHDGVELSRDELLSHQDHYLPRREDRISAEASPLDRADLTGLPPALVLLAEHDPIAPQGIAYAAALRASGVTATVRTYPGETHGFLQFPQGSAHAAEALEHAAEAIRTFLGADEHPDPLP